MTLAMIGSISLNASFILYLIHYLPQLIHNQRHDQLANMSLGFHVLLTLGYFTDLNYGFGVGMPWQYRVVSEVGLSCLIFQHCQLTKLYWSQRFFRLISYLFAGLSILSFAAIIFSFSTSYYLFMGYLAQFLAIVFVVPQIIKNYRSESAMALSLSFLCLDWLCYVCDNVSAWALTWPLPSKLGSSIGLLLITLLLVQRICAAKSEAIAIPSQAAS